jgi:hypothetical protein
MIKSLIAFSIFVAFSIFALLGASVIALPGYAPQVEAGEAVASAKGDRLDIRPATFDCSQQNWPNFDARCLRDGLSGATVSGVRLVTDRR